MLVTARLCREPDERLVVKLLPVVAEPALGEPVAGRAAPEGRLTPWGRGSPDAPEVPRSMHERERRLPSIRLDAQRAPARAA